MSYSPEQFGTKYETALNKIASLYQKTINSNNTQEQLLIAIGKINFKELFETQLGFKSEIDKVGQSYIDALRAMDGFADVDETTLRALVETDLNVYRSKFDNTYVQMKSLFTESIINGLPREVFVDRLTKGQLGVLSKSQATALFNDSMAKFNRAVTKQMALNSPKNKLYIFTGPRDTRTSDECLQVMASGPMTLGQISGRFPGVFESGTHYNCRHEFRPFTSKDMYKKQELEKQFDKRNLEQVFRLDGN